MQAKESSFRQVDEKYFMGSPQLGLGESIHFIRYDTLKILLSYDTEQFMKGDNYTLAEEQ